LWVGNTLTSTGGQISGGFNPATDYAAKFGFLSFKKEVGQQFKTFIWQHPVVFAKLTFLRFIRYFSLIRPMGFWFYQSGLGQLVFVLCSLTATAVLFITGFAGMLLAWREARPLFRYLTIFALISPLVLIPTVAQSRYRFQIYPFLAIFGAYCLMANLQRERVAAWAAKVVSAHLVIILLVDLIVFWSVIQSRLQLLIK
jgi:hypothetical protein